MAKEITEITADSKQSLTITTDAGDQFELSLNYSDLQQSWFYDIDFNDFSIKGRRIINSPNIIRSFKNILPFGISISVNDGGEPIFIDDFVSGRCALFVLEKNEVDNFENEFYNE